MWFVYLLVCALFLSLSALCNCRFVLLQYSSVRFVRETACGLLACALLVYLFADCWCIRLQIAGMSVGGLPRICLTLRFGSTNAAPQQFTSQPRPCQLFCRVAKVVHCAHCGLLLWGLLVYQFAGCLASCMLAQLAPWIFIAWPDSGCTGV